MRGNPRARCGRCWLRIAESVRDAEEIERPALDRCRCGDDGEVLGVVGRCDAVGAYCAEVGEEGPEAVRRKAFDGPLRPCFRQCGGRPLHRGDRARARRLGCRLVVVSKEHRREGSLHVEGDVVGQHPEEDVGADPLFGPVGDRVNVQVGVEGAKGPLDTGEGL